MKDRKSDQKCAFLDVMTSIVLLATEVVLFIPVWNRSMGRLMSYTTDEYAKISLSASYLQEVTQYTICLLVIALCTGLVLCTLIANLKKLLDARKKEDDIAEVFEDEDDEEGEEIVIRVCSDSDIRLFVNDDELVDDE